MPKRVSAENHQAPHTRAEESNESSDRPGKLLFGRAPCPREHVYI